MVVLRDGEARDGMGVRLGSQAGETAGSVGICLGIITVVLSFSLKLVTEPGVTLVDSIYVAELIPDMEST